MSFITEFCVLNGLWRCDINRHRRTHCQFCTVFLVNGSQLLQFFGIGLLVVGFLITEGSIEVIGGFFGCNYCNINLHYGGVFWKKLCLLSDVHNPCFRHSE